MTTSKRGLLLLVADIKKNVKTLNVSGKDMDKIYTILHDTLGELVLINYNSHSKIHKKLGGGVKNGGRL